MIRYIKQRDKSSCGPVAIMNAMKWAGEKFAAKDIEQQLKKDCFYFREGINSPYTGVMPPGLDIALNKSRSLRVKKFLTAPSLRDLDKYLDKGYAIILRYLHGDAGGHYVLCTGRTKFYYTVVNNAMRSPTVSRVSRKNMTRMLHHNVVFFSEVCFCVGWVIDKKG